MKSLKTVLALALLPALTACSPVLEYEITGSRTTAEPFTAPVGQTVTAVTAQKRPDPNFQTPDEALDGLAELDGGGSIFLIATLTDDPDNPIFPEADRISRNACVERLNAIQERYNLKIAESPTSPEELAAQLTENIQVDGYTVDLILMPADNLSPLLDGDLLLDPTRIAFFDPAAGYLDQSIASRYSGYAVWGDALLCPEDRLCVFYNVELAESLSAGDLSAAVSGGTWTLERFAQAVRLGGLASGQDPEYLVSSIYGQPGKVADLPEDVRDAAKAQLSALSDKCVGEGALEAFTGGQSLFYIGKLSDCTALTEMKAAWSLLPLPSAGAGEPTPILHEEGQREYVFLIPRFPYSPERSVQIIAALCSLSDGSKKAVYESCLPYLRLNETRILLEKVLEG